MRDPRPRPQEPPLPAAAGAASRPLPGAGGWSRARAGQELPPGAADVWLVHLAAAGEDLPDLLDAGERERAARFASARMAPQQPLARGALRSLLGVYLQRDPRALGFAVGPHGKPAVEGIRFNISHSGELALLAFSEACDVGVDVESERGRIDASAIAGRIFGAEEARRLAGLPAQRRGEEFLRGWVRHEASLKLLGTGIGGGPSEHPVGVPWIVELDVGPGAAGALALARAPSQLRLRLWPPGPAGEEGDTLEPLSRL